MSPATLAQLEIARLPVTHAQVEQLLPGYCVDPDDLLPDRQTVEFDDDLRYMAVGWTVWEMGRSDSVEDVLAEYLRFVYSMRSTKPGTEIALRQDDLDLLAAKLGWSTSRIRSHLVDLTSAWHSEPPPLPKTESTADVQAADVDEPAAAEQTTSESSLLVRLRAAQTG